jgi:hypothetical protein
MDRLTLVMVGSFLALALPTGGADAREMRVAALTGAAMAELSATGEDALSAGALGANAAYVQAGGAGTATPATPPADQTPASRKSSKAGRHKICVRGEWLSGSEFNPWTLSCTVVSY